MDPFQAGATLGDAIFGSTAGVYDEAHTKASRARDAMFQARRSQAQALIDEDRLSSRQQITPEALQAVGYTDAFAPLAQAILRSNVTLDMDQLGKFQRPGYDVAADMAMQGVLGDDPVQYNRANAFMEGKTYEPVRHVGGAFVPSGVALGDEDFTAVPTPINAERIDKMQSDAAATQRRADASVDASRALADVRRRTDPNRPRGGGKPAASSETPPVKGARKAPDGKWYVQKDGRYYRVD